MPNHRFRLHDDDGQVYAWVKDNAVDSYWLYTNTPGKLYKTIYIYDEVVSTMLALRWADRMIS